jgi:probable phosphoglycerate mutase
MATKQTDLYLVRHGETDSNVREILHGSTDVPLNSLGISQADLIAYRLQQLDRLDQLYTSPLQRARRTAEAIARKTGLPVQVHPGLAEMHFGSAEGAHFHEIPDRFPAEFSRFLDYDDLDVRYPDGESRGEFLDRVRRTLDEIVAKHTSEHIVVVAHGGFIAAALGLILEEQPGDWRRYSIANCSLTHLTYESEGPVAQLINDVVHLEQVDAVTGDVIG